MNKGYKLTSGHAIASYECGAHGLITGVEEEDEKAYGHGAVHQSGLVRLGTNKGQTNE